MQLIDGVHRLLAAVSKGHETIEVEFFDGSAADAYLRGVEANVTHGFPLSQADRRAAVERILALHPQMSDRAIAQSAGLGAKTVAAIRRRTAEDSEASGQHSARVGRDGRVRPLNGLEGRFRAAHMLAEHPQASLREVARLAGVSPTTAADVRDRLVRGTHPAVAPSPAGRSRPC
jgi:hypothetical protein